MDLKNRLDEIIGRGHQMTQLIAQAQFGDDSPEARAITRRWGITEAAELVGITPKLFVTVKKTASCRQRIRSYVAA